MGGRESKHRGAVANKLCLTGGEVSAGIASAGTRAAAPEQFSATPLVDSVMDQFSSMGNLVGVNVVGSAGPSNWSDAAQLMVV